MTHNQNTNGWGHISNGRALGIDGARGGWVCAALKQGQLTLSFVQRLSDIPFEPGDKALIDMPIGFPAKGARLCDAEAAQFLGARRSTVFSVPCRAAVEAATYREACERNAKLQGKRLSLQLWNIVPKMRELDRFMSSLPNAHERVAEAHPEAAFAMLSPAHVPLAPKRKAEGREARFAILSSVTGRDLWGTIQDFRAAHRAQLAVDDALDAIALGCLLERYQGEIVFFGDGARDDRGAPLRIALAVEPGR